MSRTLFPALALAILTTIAAAPAAAQTSHDEALWVNATVMGRVSGPLVYFAEVQPRVTDGVSRLSQVLLRPAIGYEISPTVTVYQGYAHVIEPLENGPDRNEDRLFQQVTWNVGKIGRLEVQSRTRLEQRWRSDGDGMSLRARQMMRFEYPLTPGTRRVAALGSVEGFVGLKSADWGGVTGFDQVRTFVGLEIPLPGKSTVEAGYLNQTRDAPGRGVNMAHVASLTLFVRL
jgi:hypothetical protein